MRNLLEVSRRLLYGFSIFKNEGMIRLTERSIQAVYSGFEIYWNFVSQILRQGVFNDIKKEFLKTLYEVFESILKFSINDLDCIIQKDSKSSASYFGITFLTDSQKFTVYFTFGLNNILNVYIFDSDSKIETVHVNQTLEDLMKLLENRTTVVKESIIEHRKYMNSLIFRKVIENI